MKAAFDQRWWAARPAEPVCDQPKAWSNEQKAHSIPCSVSIWMNQNCKAYSYENCCTDFESIWKLQAERIEWEVWAAVMYPLKWKKWLKDHAPEAVRICTTPFRQDRPSKSHETESLELNNSLIRATVIQIKQTRKDDLPWKSLYGCRYLSNTEGVLQCFR